MTWNIQSEDFLMEQAGQRCESNPWVSTYKSSSCSIQKELTKE